MRAAYLTRSQERGTYRSTSCLRRDEFTSHFAIVIRRWHVNSKRYFIAPSLCHIVTPIWKKSVKPTVSYSFEQIAFLFLNRFTIDQLAIVILYGLYHIWTKLSSSESPNSINKYTILNKVLYDITHKSNKNKTNLCGITKFIEYKCDDSQKDDLRSIWVLTRD